MKRPLFTAIIVLLAFGSAFSGKDKKPKAVIAPASLAVPIPLRLVAYSADSLAQSDSVNITKGDSVFIFDGGLYYRARANGHEFFISQNQLLAKSDSLVIYQNYRLINRSAAVNNTADTVDQKIVRSRCTALNKNGTRCRRLALPGKTKCWQHIEPEKSSK